MYIGLWNSGGRSETIYNFSPVSTTKCLFLHKLFTWGEEMFLGLLSALGCVDGDGDIHEKKFL